MKPYIVYEDEGILTDKIFMKEISILWNNTNRRGQFISIIKEYFGEKITLWGGVAVENILSGTPEDVRRDVRRAMECAKEGGRFILGTSHSVAVGSRYENYMAMVDEYQKWCKY